MKQQRVTIRFHNPNRAADTADYLLSLLLDANRKKLEQALREAERAETESLDNGREG